MKKIFGIVGWSGSGKTDLTTRIIEFLVNKKIVVSSLKHSHHNFSIDKEGKDSFKHIESGSNEVIIYNEKKWALISNIQESEHDVDEVIKKFHEKTEIVIIEGLKNSNFPKLEVIRSSIKKPFIFKNDKNIKGIVVDKEISGLKSSLPVFKFYDTSGIGDFILNYFENE